MRVFIGVEEIAGFAAAYAQGFRRLGHDTFSVLASRHPFYPPSQYDVVVDVPLTNASAVRRSLRRLKRRVLLVRPFLRALRSCDVFIYLFGTSCLPRHLDYWILKRFGKRLVTVFLGGDIRYWYAFEQEMRQLGMEDEVRPLIDYLRGRPDRFYADRIRTVRVAERYADLILSQPGYGQLQTRPYMRANIPLDLSQLRFNVPLREVPLVLHAPSNRGVKGTQYVLASVDQLKSEGVRFEFRLIENRSNAQVRELLAEADIVVDELFADTVGVLSSEGMATGNAVLVRYPAEHAGVPPGCPAIRVTRDTLTEKLREVIVNRDLRSRVAHAGRPYVERHNDCTRVSQQILDWLTPGGIQKHDFVPTFYRSFAMPADLVRDEQREVRRRRWTRIRQLFDRA